MSYYSKHSWTNGSGVKLNDDHLNEIEDGIENAGGPGEATIMVYAAGALNPVGPYVCDGTADQVQINAAIAALPTINGRKRGIVALSEGLFTLADSVTVATDITVTIRGAGGSQGSQGGDYATLVQLDGASNNPVLDLSAMSGGGVLVENVRLRNNSTGTGTVITTGSGGALNVIRTQINGAGTSTREGILCNTSYCSVRDSVIVTRRNGIKFATNGFYGSLVDNNYFSVSGAYYCIEVIGDFGTPSATLLSNEEPLIISRNFSDGNGAGSGSIKSTGGQAPMIVDSNYFYFDAVPAIDLTDAGGVMIINNQIGDGTYVGGAIKLTNCQDSIIRGNILYKCSHDVIVVVDSDDILIEGNQLISCGQGTANTYIGIWLDGDTNRCNVTGNVMRSKGVTNKLKWSIRVDDSTCDDNMVINNDLITSYTTADFSDAGTGTRTASTLSTNAQTGTTYTIVLSDNSKVVECLNGSAIAVTVPPNSTHPFAVGTQINVLQTGTGQVTLTAGGGVTLNGSPGLKLVGQWSMATLIKRATDTWVAVGSLAV